MSTDQLISQVIQTAVGSGLGFVLGIGAFHYQQKSQRRSEEKNDQELARLALNQLTVCAGANIEAVAQSKMQLVSKLQPEVETVKEKVRYIYDQTAADRDEATLELKLHGETLFAFFMSLPNVAQMEPIRPAEYSILSKQVPTLPLFVHRAASFTDELNARITSRNQLIAEYAREGASPHGMSPNRILYFHSMLADEGLQICFYADYALHLWKLVEEQIKAFMSKHANGVHNLKFKFPPAVLEALPDEDLLPFIKEQMTTFD